MASSGQAATPKLHLQAGERTAELEAGLVDRLGDATSDHLDGVLVGLGHQDQELVASEPAGDVHVADVHAHDGGQMGERGVSGRVSEGIVDHIEIVKSSIRIAKGCR